MSLPLRPQFRRSRLLVALVTSLTLPVAACGAGSSSTSGSSGGSAKLSIPILGAPTSLNLAQLDTGQGAYVWSSLYDTLLYFDDQAHIEPNAAKSYRYSSDRRTLTLTLRSGMTFTSGAPVNAAAVKASLDYIHATPGPNQTGLASVASVQTPDATTVVLHLSRPDAALLSNLAGVNGAIGDPATMKLGSAATAPVGSGPYTLDKSATVNGSSYVLKRRSGYWNAAAYPFATVQVKVMGDQAAMVNALRAGQLNAASVDPTQLGALKSSGLTIKQIPSGSVAELILADRAGQVLKPLGDLRVRQAINMVFNRQMLVSAFLQGAGLASDQLFNPKGQAYEAALESRYPFDVAKAKQLMAAAGYAKGFVVTMPSFVTTQPFNPLIAQSLAAIGVKVKWQTVPLPQQNSVLTSGKYPMYLVIYGLDTDATLTRTYLSTDGTPTNPFKSTDSSLAALIDQANAAGDDAAAGAAYRKINEFIVTNAWFAPIIDIGTSWVTAKGITYLGDGTSVKISIRSFGVAGR